MPSRISAGDMGRGGHQQVVEAGAHPAPDRADARAFARAHLVARPILDRLLAVEGPEGRVIAPQAVHLQPRGRDPGARRDGGRSTPAPSSAPPSRRCGKARGPWSRRRLPRGPARRRRRNRGSSPTWRGRQRRSGRRRRCRHADARRRRSAPRPSGCHRSARDHGPSRPARQPRPDQGRRGPARCRRLRQTRAAASGR